MRVKCVLPTDSQLHSLSTVASLTHAFPTRYWRPPRWLQRSVDRVKMWQLEDHKDRQYGDKDDRNSWKKMCGVGVGTIGLSLRFIEK